MESSARKCAFLKEVARTTGAHATVHQGRIERLPRFPVDVVVARGFAPLPRLLSMIEAFLSQPDRRLTALFLKGRSVDEELTEVRKQWKMRVETTASVTNPEGVVLRIEDIVRG